MVIVADTATYDTTAVNGKLLNIALFCFERIAWVTEIVATGGITLQYFIFNEKLTHIDDFIYFIQLQKVLYERKCTKWLSNN